MLCLQTGLIKLTNANIGRMVRDPEVFRLFAGHDAWVPEGCLGLAVLLSSSGVDVRFLSKGAATNLKMRWEPEQALYFSGAALISEDRQINFCLAVYELELNRKL